MKKDFSESVKYHVLSSQDGLCARCGKNLLTDFAPSFHHKKPRSLLRLDECDTDEKQIMNCVATCCQCHADIHAYKPGTARFRTKSWQPIGANEEDL